jgi:urease accessory protein
VLDQTTGISAAAHVVAEAGSGGATRLPVLSSQVPLVLRRTPDAVYLVGGAAGPLGGDELSLTIEVRDGATLRMQTAAATVALPGADGRESVFRVTAMVGAGARLEYLPEPVIVADRARHQVEVTVTLAEGAALVLRDELILGRHGERGGSCVTRLRVDYADAPLLRHELTVSGFDEVCLGPAVLAGHRAVGSLLHVEPAWATHDSDRPQARYAPGVAVMPLSDLATLVTALGPDAITLRERLDSFRPAADDSFPSI